MAEAIGSVGEDGVQRFTKSDLEALTTPGKWKPFCKTKCGQSGCDVMATKRFNSSMPFVVSKMHETFWCPECGRILCEKHRANHTCERLDQQKERNANMTPEQIAARMAEAEKLQTAKEEEEKLARRVIAQKEEAERSARKAKRKIIAGKAKIVEDFIQQMSRRQADNASTGRATAVRDQLFELYPKSKRLSLTLYNEYEEPTKPGLAEEEWEEVKTIYLRARELTGAFAAVDGQPLDLRNPWEPPPENGGDAQEGAMEP
eukprot:TRINITY_DN20361_c0_g1_i1.p1 TRINITY_DN20361_c0_g1~~TRINITY_DN20361_c0_g1_i1.p1  ORF type:complete len:260 (+),score=55.10 TRINITY_DN20361_c0_g1_i1:76-855(+)